MYLHQANLPPTHLIRSSKIMIYSKFQDIFIFTFITYAKYNKETEWKDSRAVVVSSFSLKTKREESEPS